MHPSVRTKEQRSEKRAKAFEDRFQHPKFWYQHLCPGFFATQVFCTQNIFNRLREPGRALRAMYVKYYCCELSSDFLIACVSFDEEFYLRRDPIYQVDDFETS
jgi:hypothetical protein